MISKIFLLVFAISVAFPATAASDDDPRQLVEFPAMMRQHMLGNMRNNLLSISEIQQALSAGDFEKAADVAESRLGMSSLAAHGASHMAAFMPDKMQNIGTEMHHAASRFAVVAQESAVSGDVKRALQSLADITRQCVACHAAFRVH